MHCLRDGAGDHERLIPGPPTAFSDRHPSRHVNPSGWPSTVGRRALSRRIGSSLSRKLGVAVCPGFFDPLGETVRGPSVINNFLVLY